MNLLFVTLAEAHGLKAGTLVASVKSLVVSLAWHPGISHIFERMSRVLKEMKLRGLFMAMTASAMNGAGAIRRMIT